MVSQLGKDRSNLKQLEILLRALLQCASHLDKLRRIFPLHAQPLLLQSAPLGLRSGSFFFVFTFVAVFVAHGTKFSILPSTGESRDCS